MPLAVPRISGAAWPAHSRAHSLITNNVAFFRVFWRTRSGVAPSGIAQSGSPAHTRPSGPAMGCLHTGVLPLGQVQRATGRHASPRHRPADAPPSGQAGHGMATVISTVM
jgi:hypothetical protein